MNLYIKKNKSLAKKGRHFGRQVVVWCYHWEWSRVKENENTCVKEKVGDVSQTVMVTASRPSSSSIIGFHYKR